MFRLISRLIPRLALPILVAAATATAFVALPAPTRPAAAAPDEPAAAEHLALPEDAANGDPTTKAYGAPASPCVAVASREPNHIAARVGEPVTVTIRVDTACQGEPFPVRLVLAVDTSLLMAEPAGDALRTALDTWIGTLGLGDGRGLMVGVIGFHTSATVSCRLSDNVKAVRRCLARLGTNGDARPAVGIAEGIALLRRSRSNPPGPIEPREILVLVTAWPNDPDAPGNTGCGEVMRTAGTAKGQGILLATLAVGGAAHAPCLRSAATSPRYAFATGSGRAGDALEGLTNILDGAMGEYQTVFVQRIAITDTLPSSVELLADTIRPRPSIADPAGATVAWAESVVPARSITFAYQVMPFAPGAIVLPRRAVGTFQDTLGRRRTFPIPQALIEVAGP